MRIQVIQYYIGLFLRIFSVLLLVPLAVGKWRGETFAGMEPFLLASFLAIAVGSIWTRTGKEGRPTAIEAMATASGSWIIAVAIGAIPVYMMMDITVIEAYFDSMAGLTTTGMVIIPHHQLPDSLLFWRVFMQWIGGLGILTFFVMVLAESGGVASKLVSTEANKTESGIIRPSLFNAIKSMWYVYLVLTIVEAGLLYYFEVPWFHAVGHALATMPTGGFSTTGQFPGMMSGGARAVLTIFMFLGGTNFLLLYGLFKGNIRQLVHDYEFRMYFTVFCTGAGLIVADLVLHKEMALDAAARTAVFHTSSIISSAGFMLQSINEFPTFSKAVFLLLMFVGGSLGSTTGGFKMLRLGVMIRAVRHHIQSLTLPPTVMHPITVKGRILDENEVIEIASFFFMWLAVILFGGLITLWMTPHGITEAAQLMTSAVGTMGPTFITPDELRALPPLVKFAVAMGMLAGRLEMLPILALLNRSILRK